jgi:hypothetical protein
MVSTDKLMYDPNYDLVGLCLAGIVNKNYHIIGKYVSTIEFFIACAQAGEWSLYIDCELELKTPIDYTCFSPNDHPLMVAIRYSNYIFVEEMLQMRVTARSIVWNAIFSATVSKMPDLVNLVVEQMMIEPTDEIISDLCSVLLGSSNDERYKRFMLPVLDYWCVREYCMKNCPSLPNRIRGRPCLAIEAPPAIENY